jgi:hypothetical protein
LAQGKAFDTESSRRVADNVSKLGTAIELTEGLSLPLVQEIDSQAQEIP